MTSFLEMSPTATTNKINDLNLNSHEPLSNDLQVQLHDELLHNKTVGYFDLTRNGYGSRCHVAVAMVK